MPWRVRMRFVRGTTSRRILLGSIPLVVALFIWVWMDRDNDRFTFLFSRPWLILRTLYADVAAGTLIQHTFVTAAEALTGLLLATVIGVTLGLALWGFEKAAPIARIYVALLASIPLIAVAPM